MAAKILKGNLKLGTSAETAVDVSDETTGFTIKADVDEVEVPATLATPKSSRAGAVKWTIDLGYLADDATGTLADALFTAVATPEKELYFEGSMTDDVVSADNPLWTGTLVVMSAQVGGNAEELMTGSGTFPLTGAPEKLTTEGS